MNVSGSTQLLGVIGHPVGHSLSPRMHNAALVASGLDYVYVPMEVHPRNLPAAVRGLAALGFRGFNVTMPHKEGLISLVDELDGAARVSGAVNTVTIENERLYGRNTDGSGFLEACGEAGVRFAGKRVLLVGAGGAAAAVAVAVLGEEPLELRIANRTPDRARRLENRLRALCPAAAIRTYSLEDVGAAARGAEVVVNTTYLGMYEEDDLPLPETYLASVEAVCDVVYRRDGETRLLGAARERGVRTVSGDRMLLYQGVQALRGWIGVEPDVAAMGEALSR